MTDVRPERSNWRSPRRNLGNTPGPRHARRPRLHTRRGQRPRHAHVREDVPREPHRLRAHGRGAHALSEDLSFRRIIRLAENVERAALYMMHVSARTGVDAIAESRARGFPIYGETLHQYALFTSDDYERPNGQMYHTYPSLKTKADHKALWQGDGGRQHQHASRPTASARRLRSRRRANASTTRSAATPASSRAWRSCIPSS